jgi:DNA-binding PadR family transcriptional regulator
MKEDFDQFLPLSPATLHILLAPASEDRHGYGIRQAVARQSDNRYKLGPGTLYDNLQSASQRNFFRPIDVLSIDSLYMALCRPNLT